MLLSTEIPQRSSRVKSSASLNSDSAPSINMPPTTKDGERPFKKAKFYRSLEEIITLEVGEGDKQAKLKVHKNIICATSPFFEAACKPEWMNDEDKVIKLPEDDPEIIRLLIYWAYHDKICVPCPEESWRDMNLEDARNTKCGLLVGLYLLAERLQIDRLKIESIDAIIDNNGITYVPYSLIYYVYENTLPESWLRQLMLDIVRFKADYQHEDYVFLMCRDLLEDLVKASWGCDNEADGKYPEHVRPIYVEFCKRYHKHSKEVATCAKLKDFDSYDSDDG